MAKKNTIESPAGYGPNSGPRDALSMPVKHYPDSTKLATHGKPASIESPAPKK